MATLLIQTQRHIIGFIVWWIYQMPTQIFRWFEGLMSSLDTNLQFAKNIRLWLLLEPLFGDYGWRGRLVGFFMRGVRAIVTAIAYLAVFAAGMACILGWVAILPLSIMVILKLI